MAVKTIDEVYSEARGLNDITNAHDGAYAISSALLEVAKSNQAIAESNEEIARVIAEKGK